uniref:proline-rich protein 23A3-like n=1 Tax=Myodes glareolus TaxID=447135 RepID=UPI002020F043|nr:proline-rich protein 23A3-like [Myodes glareolus]
MPRWGPQPEDPMPAKRRRLQEPACWLLAQPDLEAFSRPASEQLTSMVVIPTGCAMKLQLEGVDLLLEPEPTSVMQVSLPGHTIILVPEGLQASFQPGQPVFWPASMQEDAVLNMPQDHDVFAFHQGFNSPSLSYNQSFAQEDSQENFVISWMNAPTRMAPEILSPFTGVFSPLFQGQMPCPWSASCPPSAGRYAPWSLWSLKGSMLCPLPSSPLQPLPPSPPPSHQKQASQSRQKPPRPRCKAQRRLF